MTTDDPKTEFIRLASSVWGYGYQTRAAKYFDVSDRAVRRWCSGESSVPVGILDELRKMADILPPPAGTTAEDDRDDDCYTAIEPAVAKLVERAVAKGWSLAEVLTALLAISVSEMHHRAGGDATRRTLQAAILNMDD